MNIFNIDNETFFMYVEVIDLIEKEECAFFEQIDKCSNYECFECSLRKKINKWREFL